MAKKNANGDGSRPRKRPDGRYEARYWIDTPDGRKRRSVYASSSKECAEKLAEAKKEANEPQTFVPTTITVKELLTQYEEVAKETMKRRSYETYQSIARNHLLPAFGGLNLSDLTREQVQRMYSSKRQAGLSAARVRRIHGVLSAVLNTAVRWRMIPHNVCKEVTPPRVPTPEVRPLSLEEARRLLDAAEGSEYHALIVLGVTSGARWGELGGLRWSDLDLDRREMRISRSLIKGKGGYTFDSPKTRGSRRSLTLTRRAVAALQRHKERQQIRGISTDGDALVFTNGAGNPVNHSHFTRNHFKPLLRKAGLPQTNWHAATRHTATCLLLLEKTNPKSVAMQMGWSSVGFLLDTYARFLPGWGDDGVMDGLLG